MTTYGMYLLATERIQERLDEADRERLARPVAADPGPGRPWRARLAHAIARRLERVAEAA